jgi:hypothetical protein
MKKILFLAVFAVTVPMVYGASSQDSKYAGLIPPYTHKEFLLAREREKAQQAMIVSRQRELMADPEYAAELKSRNPGYYGYLMTMGGYPDGSLPAVPAVPSESQIHKVLGEQNTIDLERGEASTRSY